jgi:lipopolysaccharide transport system permease protein
VLSAINPVVYAQAFHEGASLMTRHARLTVAMARRDLVTRYAGQFVGSFWIIGHPLFMTALFVFIFGVVFKTRIGGTQELPLDYTTYILAGLTPWLTMLNALTMTPNSVLANVSLVKQFNFHLEVLPAKEIAIAAVTWAVGIVVVPLYVVAVEHMVLLTWLLLPVVFVVQVIAMLGIGFMFSAITVFFRDLKDLIALYGNIGTYLIPVVYLPGWVPPIFKPLLYANPFSYMTWMYQDVLYFGRIEHPIAWIVFPLFSVVVFALGYRVFRRLKPFFGGAL